MIEHTNNLTRPLKLNDLYYVPCFFKEYKNYLKYNGINNIIEKLIIPYIDYYHDDVENGQKEKHYHFDDRFIPVDNDTKIPSFYPTRFTNFQMLITEKYYKRDIIMKCVSLKIDSITPLFNIKNSKLKHKCIHKNKCPHRGYDLSNELVINGIITCPLHNLKFDSITKKLLNE